MLVNFNAKQYFFSVIFLILVFVLALQINYQRQNENDFLGFLSDDALAVFEIDLVTSNRDCLLGRWCFVESRENLFVDWLSKDTRRLRLFDGFNFKTPEIIKLSQSVENKLYLVLVVNQEEVIESVWLTKFSQSNEAFIDSLRQQGFYVLWQDGWMIFSENKDLVTQMYSQKKSPLVEFSQKWPKKIDTAQMSRINYISGLLNASKFTQSNFNFIPKGLEIELLEKNSYQDIGSLYFSVWFDRQKLNFSLDTQNSWRSDRLVNAYDEIKLDPLFKLQPQFIFESNSLKAITLPDKFGVLSQKNFEKYIWMNLVNLEEDFELENMFETSQVLILPRLLDEEIINFKNSNKVALAKLLPIRKELVLPDGEVVYELVAEPSRFKFDSENIKDYQLEYLIESEFDHEIAIAYDDDKVIITDSKDVLSSLIHAYDKKIDSVWSREGTNSDITYFNLSNKEKSFFGLNNLLIEDLTLGNNLWLRGVIE